MKLAIHLVESYGVFVYLVLIGHKMQARDGDPELLHTVAGDNQPQHVETPVIGFLCCASVESDPQFVQERHIHHILHTSSGHHDKIIINHPMLLIPVDDSAFFHSYFACLLACRHT